MYTLALHLTNPQSTERLEYEHICIYTPFSFLSTLLSCCTYSYKQYQLHSRYSSSKILNTKNEVKVNFGLYSPLEIIKLFPIKGQSWINYIHTLQNWLLIPLSSIRFTLLQRDYQVTAIPLWFLYIICFILFYLFFLLYSIDIYSSCTTYVVIQDCPVSFHLECNLNHFEWPVNHLTIL